MKKGMQGAALAAWAGVVMAAPATAQDLFQACSDNATGAVRAGSIEVNAVPLCRARETLRNWNQVGPQGPQGPQGAQGPAGPSAGYYRTGQPGLSLPVTPIGSTPLYSDVGSLSLPAGNYVITATAIVGNGTFDTSEMAAVRCVVQSPYATAYGESALYAHDTATVVATSGFVLPGADTVRLRCQNQNPWGSVVLTQFTLVAIKVGTLEQQ